MAEYVKLAFLIEERMRGKGAVEIVSGSSWYVLPFLFWLQMYWLFPQFFVVTWGLYFGLAIFLFLLLWGLQQNLGLRRYRRKLMEKIERARILSSDRTRTEVEGKFGGEADRFGVRYVYYEPLFILALLTGSKRKKVLRSAFACFALALGSYSIMVVLVKGRELMLSIVSFPPSEVLQFINSLLPQYLPYLIGLFFCLSLLDRTRWRFGGISWFDLFVRVLCSLYNTVGVIHSLVYWVALKLYIFGRCDTSITLPLVKTIDLPSVIEKSMRNIEGVSCEVLQRNYETSDSEDFEAIKAIMIDETEPPCLGFQSLIKLLKPSDALDSIRTMHPVFYLCMIENRCAVVGADFHCLTEKAFMAAFDFDSKYVKKEFEKIMNNEIERQRELK